jgi:L-histidine N-alpha-methyltransferase
MNTSFEIVSAGPRGERRSTMAREVRAGLLRRPRSIPPKYFYDEVGSRLFDAICELPEYYLTRAERSLLVEHSDAIIEESGAAALIEIGSGMARKTGPLLRSMCARFAAPSYVPFDIAPDVIEHSAHELMAAHPTLHVRGVVGDFVHDCGRLGAATGPFAGPRLLAFLGSTIGNLDETEAPALLATMAELMTDRDRFLIGIDLVKETRALTAAYNDSQGVTAKFNKNVLRVLARELDGDIDEASFEHFAFYDEARSRIEMHLVSTRDQRLVLRGADLNVEVARGEHVLTEVSRKFTRASAEQLLAAGGLRLTGWMSDGRFALCVARAPRSS